MITHHKVHDQSTNSLPEVENNVRVEPSLLLITGKHFQLSSTTSDDGQLDVVASGSYHDCHFIQTIF